MGSFFVGFPTWHSELPCCEVEFPTWRSEFPAYDVELHNCRNKKCLFNIDKRGYLVKRIFDG